MTLDEMYIQTASYADETISKNGTSYTGDNLTIVNKFKSAINYAKNIIAKERYRLDTKETVVLDVNKEIDLSALTKNYFKIINVTNSADTPIPVSESVGNKLKCPTANIGDSVNIYYYYIPNDLSNLADVWPFDDEKVDPKIACYYAAFQYLLIEGDGTASNWLSLFNDGFQGIDPVKFYQNSVFTVYSMG